MDAVVWLPMGEQDVRAMASQGPADSGADSVPAACAGHYCDSVGQPEINGQGLVHHIPLSQYAFDSRHVFAFAERHRFPDLPRRSNVRDIVEAINRRHATTFRHIERYTTGEQGAYLLVDDTGDQFVLKWSPDPRAHAHYIAAKSTTVLLRDLGYMAPEYVLVGRTDRSYSIQRVLPGIAQGALTNETINALIKLNRLQIGQAFLEPHNWPSRIVNVGLHGGDGYCLLEPLRNHSPTTAELLHTLQSLIAAHVHEDFSTNDIVHFDFQPANILTHENFVTGIVDWDGTCSGDCVFDLTTLLFYCYDIPTIRTSLWNESLNRVSPEILTVYFAHLIHRQVDWSIRNHDIETVDHYISRAQEILHDITQL